MTAFVEECRREWRRLGVPDSIADEMASEIEADLAEASADGVSEAEMLGESDPRRFAASWASARGVATEQRTRERRSFWRVFVALLVVLLVGVVLGVLLVVKGAHKSIHTRTRVVEGKAMSVPDLVGMREPRAAAILEARGLRIAVVAVRHGPAGVVVVQVPPAGSLVPRGSTVLLRVARAA